MTLQITCYSRQYSNYTLLVPLYLPATTRFVDLKFGLDIKYKLNSIPSILLRDVFTSLRTYVSKWKYTTMYLLMYIQTLQAVEKQYIPKSAFSCIAA